MKKYEIPAGYQGPLDAEYREKLDLFVGQEVPLYYNENGSVEVIKNYETVYILRQEGSKYILYTKERDRVSERDTFHSKEEAQEKFSLYMRGVFGHAPQYTFPASLGRCRTDEELNIEIFNLFHPKWFSVCSIEVG